MQATGMQHSGWAIAQSIIIYILVEGFMLMGATLLMDKCKFGIPT